MRLKVRVVIVTGGGRGIGKAIAKAFAREGAIVVIAATTLSKLEETVEEIEEKGGRGGDGRTGYPMRSPHCCTKMGVIGLTETLSIEVGPCNIRVNAISAAAVRGERLETVVRGRSAATRVPFEELMGQITKNSSLGRPAEETELASCAVFLASDESSAITGQTIVNHCGQHIVN
jgi:NAD(P)-dependent dehydrogenase (short-subunit alcohol dehydrogenase family)